MALRSLTRGLFQMVSNRKSILNYGQQYRCLTSVNNLNETYKDLNKFLEKEVKLEKMQTKSSNKLLKIKDFEIQTNGPLVTLTRQNEKDKITVKWNVTNTVDDVQSNDENSTNEQTSVSSHLKSRPTFTIDINHGGETLSFSCSYLPRDYPDGLKEKQKEDFQIDEFTIHNGDWNDNIYSADCAIIDDELYDKLLALLKEHGIDEDFASQLADYSTMYEHEKYINLLENLKKYSS